MKPILLVAVLMWPALVLTACSDPTKVELYDAAVELQEQGRLYDAIVEYDKVLKMDPQFAEAYGQRGLANASLHRNELAIQDYDKALQIDPGSHETYFNRGKLYELGDSNSAIEDYSQAIRLMPESSDYYHRRANVYAIHGQVDLALADYAEAIRLNEDSTIYLDRGIFHGNLSRKQKALDDFTEAIRLDASNEEAYAMRAVWNALVGNDTAAQRDLEKAVNLGYDRPLLEASIEGVKSLR